MANWYRMDKSNGAIDQVVDAAVNVLRAARGNYNDAAGAMAEGRFQTVFAFYIREDKLTDGERQVAGLAPTDASLEAEAAVMEAAALADPMILAAMALTEDEVGDLVAAAEAAREGGF